MKYQIVVYGTDGSGSTAETRQRLESLGIDHRYVDIDDSAARDKVEREPDGKRRLPVVEISSDLGERQLTAPDRTKLEEELHRLGIVRKGEANVSRPGS